MSGMIALVKALEVQEGYNLTALPDVRILRADRPLARTPVLYDPGIVIVCQGSKRGFFGQQTYLYDEQHYLAVSVPVPFVMETDASAEHPLLAIYLHLDFQLAAELMLQIEQHHAPHPPAAPQSMMSSPMDDAVKTAVLRLLEVLNNRPGAGARALFPRPDGRPGQGHARRAGLTGAVRQNWQSTAAHPCRLR